MNSAFSSRGVTFVVPRPQHPAMRRGLALAVGLCGLAAAELSDITYFATIFSSNTPGWRDAKSATRVSQTSLLSLASVPNLNGNLTVVTHASYNGLPALAKIISPIVRLHVLNDDEVDFDTRPANWVLRVELMKYHFVRRQAAGAKVVYVELDQLFLPGAGRLFEATFDNHAFDAAFTFNLRRERVVCVNTRWGCVNTGVVLFRAGPKATLLLDLASKKTLSITGNFSTGGENQRAIGSFFPHLNVTTNETYTNPELNFTIHSVLGGFGGPLNFNSAGCCHLPSAVVVAHFKSDKKEWSRDECCRDRVAVNPGAWRATCSCRGNLHTVSCASRSARSRRQGRWCEA